MLMFGALAAARLGAAAAPFSASKETDPGSQIQIVVLRFEDRKQPARSLEARIATAGANLFSLKSGDEELLVQAPSLAELATSPAGTPVLFPMPNRVRDGVFVFEGRRFQFPPNNGPNFIHGLVRRRPFQAGEPVARADEASASLWLDWDATQPDFALFPLEHRLTLTFTLSRDGLNIGYAVENKGSGRLPFGFGLHPWFRVPGERGAVFLKVPAAQRMEAVDKLPTGKLLPVQKSPFDLRRPTALAGLDLDDVYFGMTPDAAPGFEWRDRGIKVSLGASRQFTHLVVFTPPERPTFCIENQTSSTDAHNLHARGLAREAHLIIVEPGKTARGSVDWKISRKLR
jgi:aldose 1-epimerase